MIAHVTKKYTYLFPPERLSIRRYLKCTYSSFNSAFNFHSKYFKLLANDVHCFFRQSYLYFKMNAFVCLCMCFVLCRLQPLQAPRTAPV